MQATKETVDRVWEDGGAGRVIENKELKLERSVGWRSDGRWTLEEGGTEDCDDGQRFGGMVMNIIEQTVSSTLAAAKRGQGSLLSGI